MIGPKVATVFGGSGFIGRYVVKRLAARGHVVRVAVRDTEAALFLKPMGVVGQIVPLCSDLTRPDDVTRAVEGAEIVVNLVGILAESRRGDFQRVHADGAGAIARVAAKAGTSRLVHVSAIGADPAGPSEYAKSKAAGEEAVRTAFSAAAILRPSVVFGAEDRFFNRFGTMAQFLPCMPVIFGSSRMQPVYVGDVADAVMAVIDRTDAPPAVLELGGPHIFTFRQILQYVLRETGRHRLLIPIPPPLARLQAAILERLPGKLLTRDQLLLLARDNVVSPDAPGLADLGITPTPLDLVAPQYLRRFRPGGGRRELIAA